MITHWIIWDWNGTLLDDVQEGVVLMNRLLESHGYPAEIDFARYREIFRFPIEEYYRLAGFDFTRHPYQQLANEWFAMYRQQNHAYSLMEGAADILKAMQGAGCKQLLLSASEKTLLLEQTARSGVAGYFEEILGRDDIYAGSKTQLGLTWLAKGLAVPEQTVFIGDSTHDYETAVQMGCRPVLIAAGHQSRQQLEQCGAPVLSSIREVPALLQQFWGGSSSEV